LAGLPSGLSQIISLPHTQVITNTALTIAALGSSYYKFVVPPGATDVLLSGHFTATGGMGNDIEVYVLSDDEFVNFQTHHSTQTFYNSGRITQDSFNARLPGGGTYYLVFSNNYSLLTPKAVQADAVLHYTN
jgi:hypothetical protein